MNDPKGILDEVKKAVVGKDGVLVMVSCKIPLRTYEITLLVFCLL